MKKFAALSLACSMTMGCLAGCGGKSGGSKANSSEELAFVESYLKATYDEPDGYIHYTSITPESSIELAKSTGEWDKAVDGYTGHFFLNSTGSKHDPDSVEKVANLSDKEIGYAEMYFEDEYNQKVKANSGSVYYTTIEIFYKDNDTKKLYGYLTVLDLDGEGLKICPYNPTELERKYADYE